MKIKGAIFDMDGTLVDSLSFWNFLWHEIGVKYLGDSDFHPCEEIDKKVRTMILSDAMAYVAEYYKLNENPKDLCDFTASYLHDFYKNESKPKDGALELLEHLKTMGIPMCVASASVRDDVVFALKCHGMYDYFDKVISCADIGAGKDKPDIYLLAAGELGKDVCDICVFEDSYIALETAKAAGFMTVGVFDENNFEQGRLEAASNIYVADGESLAALIEHVKAAD